MNRNKIMSKFSDWLEQELKERGMSQSELARKAGVTRAAINGVLSGARGPGVNLIKGIARAFNIPAEEVFRHADILPPSVTKNELIERIINELRDLPHEERENVIAYIKMMRDLRDKRKKKK